MRPIVKSAALAALVCAIALADAPAAEKSQPTSDPGEQIKEGAIKFGHGVRDGAIRAWDAVKSVFGSDTSNKRRGQTPQGKASDAAPGSK